MEAAASTNAVPQSDITPGQQPFEIEGRAAPAGVRRVADRNAASDGYFEALKIRMVSGRAISASDTADSPPVTVINESMARYWDGADPIGTRILVQEQTPVWRTVIGIAPDFRLYSADRERQVPAQFYAPVSQSGGFAGGLMVRTSGDPMTFVPALKAAVHGADPQIPVEEIQTLADLRNERQASPRLTTILLGLFAMVADGNHARRHCARSPHRSASARANSGCAWRWAHRRAVCSRSSCARVLGWFWRAWPFGLVGAVGFSEVLTAYLYDTPATDPSAYIAVAVVFLAAGILACVAPAKRATSIDPLTSLKAD